MAALGSKRSDAASAESERDLPKRRVALVFDEGPIPADAESLMAILLREKVRASFSLIGAHVLEHPEMARKIAAAGFEINNHSQNHLHPKDLSDAALVQEIAEAQHAITTATGVAPRWYWAPYVEIDERVKRAAKQARITVFVPKHLVVAKDYDRTVSASGILHNATTDVTDGSVILFH
jgi:peptidoglycan/xylan/chitin deacetylase (PgdA/CDA1 family)